MKTHKREIVIYTLAALAILSAVCYFFGKMKESKEVVQTDLFSLTAPEPYAILTVNRPATFAKMMLAKPRIYQVFASEIPEIYLSILKQNTTIPSLQFSFHPSGIVMYAKADKSIAERIESEILRKTFNSFAPQIQTKGEIAFTYFPDTDNRFFGFYRYNGIWVASYSKKLLEKVADMQINNKNHITEEEAKLYKTLDVNAPLNLLIKSEKLDLFPKANDLSQWGFNGKWLGADLFESEGNICYFSNLPYYEPADTLYQTIIDTLSVRLKKQFPQLHITGQSYEENGKFYYTGCTN